MVCSSSGASAELHPQGLQFVGHDFVLGRGLAAVDLSTAAAHLFGQSGDFVLRNVAIIAIEDFAGDMWRGEQHSGGSSHVGGVDFLAAPFAGDVAPLNHVAHQFEPFALLDGLRSAIDARRPQGTNLVALAPAVAVNKLLDRRFVCAVVAGGRGGVRLVERPVGEDAFVDGACGNENEASDARRSCRFDEFDRADDVFGDEIEDVPFAASEAAAGMVQSRMNHGLATFDQRGSSAGVSQLAGDPFHLQGNVVQPTRIAPRSEPAAAAMTQSRKMADDVSADEAGCAGDGNFHGWFLNERGIGGTPRLSRIIQKEENHRGTETQRRRREKVRTTFVPDKNQRIRLDVALRRMTLEFER